MTKNITYNIIWIFVIATLVGCNCNCIDKSLLNESETYVIVQGTWGGSWCYKEVDSLLTAKEHIVYRPSLTGLGERVHLSSPDIGLNTHILDVVNTILYEDLTDIILVGHSYGGTIISGVADSIPHRIKKLIYVDAIFPKDGEHCFQYTNKERMEWYKSITKNGLIYPPWVKEGQKPPKDVPHPLKTRTDTISLKNPLAIEIPLVYIFLYEEGTDPKEKWTFRYAQRAKERDGKIYELTGDHNIHRTAPETWVDILLKEQ